MKYKKSFFLFLLYSVFVFSACKDEVKLNPESVHLYQGAQVIFWTNNSSYGDIDVYISLNKVGTITSYSSYQPNCGSSGFVTINVPQGSLFYNAQSTDGLHSWGNSTTIIQGCNNVKLE